MKKDIRNRHHFAWVMILALLIPWGRLEAISFSVSPIRVEHSVPAGGTITEAITIANADTAPAHIRVKVEDWWLTQDGAIAFGRAGSQSYSAASWIRVNPREFDLGPGQSQECPLFPFRSQGCSPRGLSGSHPLCQCASSPARRKTEADDVRRSHRHHRLSNGGEACSGGRDHWVVLQAGS